VFQVGKNDNNLTKRSIMVSIKNKVRIIITAPIKYGANHVHFYGITLAIFALINEEAITITSLYAQKSANRGDSNNILFLKTINCNFK
jgi:hypothetical protein